MESNYYAFLFGLQLNQKMLYSLAIIFLLSVVQTKGYPYNEFKYFDDRQGIVPRFPDTCCQLEWINIGEKDALPNDHVIAGTYSNRNWAYV